MKQNTTFNWLTKKPEILNLHDPNTDNIYYERYRVAKNLEVIKSDSHYLIRIKGLNNKHSFSINVIDLVFYFDKLILTQNNNSFYIESYAEASSDLLHNINKLLSNNAIKNNIKYVYYANAISVYVESISDVDFILNNIQHLSIDQYIPTAPQYTLDNVPQALHVLYKYFKLFEDNNDNDRPKFSEKNKQLFINTTLPLIPLINDYLDTFQQTDTPLSEEAQILGNIAEYFCEIYE